MTTSMMRNALQSEPWADGCIFRPQGVVCKDKEIDCAHCGWCPAEEKRRKLALWERCGKKNEEEKPLRKRSGKKTGKREVSE